MKAIRFLHRRRVPTRYLFVVSVVTVGLGLIAGTVTAQRPDQHPRFEFADGERVFCGDEGRIDVSHTDFEDNPTGGFKIPEGAVDEFVVQLRHAASGGQLPEGAKLPDGLLELLEPSRQFNVSERQDINGNLIYFDLPSSKESVLEARIVVERIGEGFQVTETYICEAQLVSDPAELGRIWAEEVRKHEDQ